MNQAMGRKTWRIAGVLVVQHSLPRGFNYLYCPRPAFETVQFSDFSAACSDIAQTEQSIFLKIDAKEKISTEHINAHIGNGRPLQPRQTIILDISKSEDELLTGMHEKTRYNIRLAERKGVDVVNVIYRDTKEDFEIFWNLLETTAMRQGFHPHQREYYELLSQMRTNEMSNEFFFARRGDNHGEVLAVALVNIHHDPRTGASSATYLHGASSRDHKELMAPYLLHWRIMQAAKRRNIHYYDLWGIDEKKWPGITRFKMGFGVSRVEYPPSVHIIYRPVWYVIYTLMELMRK